MPQDIEKIRQKLALLPEQPGVYLMKDEEGLIIYVGKALVLKNRVKSYFTGQPADNKTEQLVKHICDFDYIITNSESEAFILEANLIKKYKPHYNILLKDDKKYPFLKITMQEAFPRILVTRDIVKDGSKYYGPYTDVKYLRKTIRTLEWIFPHRTCTRNIPETPIMYKRACINYQMKKCPAPCIGEISRSDYRRIILRTSNFLLGKNQDLIKELSDEMLECSENMQYEKAAQLRDQIREIERVQKSQTMYFADEKNRDIIALYKEEAHTAVTVLKIVLGKMSAKEVYSFKNTENEPLSAILSAFLLQYYAEKLDELPHQIVIQSEPDDFEHIEEILGKKVHIPQRGEFKQLIAIAEKNAFDFVEAQKLSYMRKSTRTIVPVQELKEKLNLKRLPRKMICLDISTIQGSDTVSSLVFFENGKPLKRQYRHFSMKTLEGQNDFAAMAETMTRFLSHLEDESGWEKPDLIVIDGGKGQLSSSYQILKESKFDDIEMISLAKRVEEVYLPNQDESIYLPRNSSALRLLINIRDEAHRFAITYHRKKRNTRTLYSQLDDIKGIGEEKKILLLKTFGSVTSISKASIEELSVVKGIGEKFATIIYNYFKEKA